VFEVTQTGAGSFSFTSMNPFNRLQSWGMGTVSGRRVDSTFRTNIPSSGSGTGMLSEDGRQLTGTYYDSSVGTYTQTLTRE
jgi:hypothetical protein